MKKVNIVLGIAIFAILACQQSNPIHSLSKKNDSISKMKLAKSNENNDYGNIIFGPDKFTRTTGKPILEKRSFNLVSSLSKYLLVLHNGGGDKKSVVSNAFVILNNDTIIQIDDKSNKIEREISLQQNNLICVQIMGKPGTFLTLTIYDINACGCTATDIEGNIYQTVKIGNQCWMVENLKTSHYRNGELIHNEIDDNNWSYLSVSAYCDYQNAESFSATYGKLYNWFAINDSRNIAPEGWHIPSDEEWKILEMYLGMSEVDANKISWRGTVEGGSLKEIGTIHWLSPNTGATNSSGFTAIPGGTRNDYGSFSRMGRDAAFWSSTSFDQTTAWMRYLGEENSDIYRFHITKTLGYSVRCIKD
jgi:uncharacterized protein (TIGR02145 family)